MSLSDQCFISEISGQILGFPIAAIPAMTRDSGDLS
jgi:hypothetical protein